MDKWEKFRSILECRATDKVVLPRGVVKKRKK